MKNKRPFTDFYNMEGGRTSPRKFSKSTVGWNGVPELSTFDDYETSFNTNNITFQMIYILINYINT